MFCTSIAALRHIAALLSIVGVNVLTLHAQRQQRARLKVSQLFRQLVSVIKFFISNFLKRNKCSLENSEIYHSNSLGTIKEKNLFGNDRKEYNNGCQWRYNSSESKI